MKLNQLGCINYSLGLELQMQELEEVSRGAEDRLLICSHEPVVTTGRSTDPSDLLSWDGEVHEVSRGGRATYHGPSQVIVYPILNLKREDRRNLRTRDIHSYLRLLESAIINSLNSIGLNQAEARTTKSIDTEGRELSVTGVWIKDKKIASIGVGVKKWITYHGLAINFDQDDKAFIGIRPCGFSPETMTSIEAELGHKVDRDEFVDILCENLISNLN